MTVADALAVSTWRYPGPYAIYDSEPDDWSRFLVPAYRYHAVLDDNELVAYGCFGEDARVAGGSYPPDALDIGAGTRPDLVGQRRGKALLDMLLDLAAATYGATAFRSTVAAFNHRALALCRSVGFVELARFISSGALPREFVILQR
jgi:GNAT superfamily N-acetyltransferase